MSRKMTQAEAHSWRTRAIAAEKMLRAQRTSWAEEWPNGTRIAVMELSVEAFTAIRTARMLKHAVVAADVSVSSNRVAFFALPLPEQEHP